MDPAPRRRDEAAKHRQQAKRTSTKSKLGLLQRRNVACVRWRELVSVCRCAKGAR